MDGYGIQIHTERRGTQRFRLGFGADQEDRWELAEAEELAHNLLHDRNSVVYVAFGNGEHEFRRWGGDMVTTFGNFSHPGCRWATWYVDVEINGHRWRYRPVADLDNEEAATDVAEAAFDLPEVTKVWTGNSDTGEEYEDDKYEDKTAD